MATEISPTLKNQWMRMGLLSLSSVVLCLSSLMAVLTPFPIAIGYILFGFLKGSLLFLFSLVVVGLSSAFLFQDYSFLGLFSFLGALGFFIGLGLRLKKDPVSWIVGLGIVVALLGGVFGFMALQQKSVSFLSFATEQVDVVMKKIQLAQQQGELQKDMAELGLNRSSKEIASDLIQVIPGYLIAGLFFTLWMNTYLALKTARALLAFENPDYNETKLLGFKMPWFFVYIVIGALLLALWGDFLGAYFPSVGSNILRVLGVFYFFQGMGIGFRFLDKYGIFGFSRTLVVMGSVFFLSWGIALFGFFDTWFEFDTKLLKNKNKNNK